MTVKYYENILLALKFRPPPDGNTGCGGYTKREYVVGF